MKERLKSAPDAVLEKWPILDELIKVHRQKLAKPDMPLPPGYEHKREIERRYLPDVAVIRQAGGIDAFFTKLLNTPSIYARMILQTNVSVYADRKKKKKQQITFRLRRTKILREDDEGGLYHSHAHSEDALCRIAIKSRVPGIDNAHDETQRVLTVSEQRDERALQSFSDLEEMALPDTFVIRTRAYVIDWPLPNGGKCEIHFERNHGPTQNMTDVFRVEIEFDRPEDQDYVRGDDPKKPLKKGLPAWIGLDVTDDPHMKNASMVKRGPPEHARKIMNLLKSPSNNSGA